MSEDESRARSEIVDLYKGFVEAVKSGNPENTRPYFTEDAILMMPGVPKMVGYDAALPLLNGLLTGLVDFEIEVGDVHLVDDKTAIEIGKNKMVHEIDGELKVSGSGYVVLWVRQDGSWKAHWDIGVPSDPLQ